MQLVVNVHEGYHPAQVCWPTRHALFSVDTPQGPVEIMEVHFWTAARGWVVLCAERTGCPGRTEVLPQDLMRVREYVAVGWPIKQALAALFGPPALEPKLGGA